MRYRCAPRAPHGRCGAQTAWASGGSLRGRTGWVEGMPNGLAQGTTKLRWCSACRCRAGPGHEPHVVCLATARQTGQQVCHQAIKPASRPASRRTVVDHIVQQGNVDTTCRHVGDDQHVHAGRPELGNVDLACSLRGPANTARRVPGKPVGCAVSHFERYCKRAEHSGVCSALAQLPAVGISPTARACLVHAAMDAGSLYSLLLQQGLQKLDVVPRGCSAEPEEMCPWVVHIDFKRGHTTAWRVDAATGKALRRGGMHASPRRLGIQPSLTSKDDGQLVGGDDLPQQEQQRGGLVLMPAGGADRAQHAFNANAALPGCKSCSGWAQRGLECRRLGMWAGRRAPQRIAAASAPAPLCPWPLTAL